MRELSIYVIRAETVRETDCALLAKRMPRRYERAMQYRLERDRLLCLGAGLLMMNVLDIRDEREILYGQFGKPYIPGKPAFCISHSGSCCILASGDAARIGADIEEIDARHMDIAKEVCTQRELAWMEKDPAERFFRLWTWKECVMKATGMGMQLEPGSVEVLPFAEGSPVRIMDWNWYAWGGRLDGCCISACADEPIGRVRQIE